MTDLVLWDDAQARRFEPFILTRPVAAIRAGALMMHERWARALGAHVTGTVTSAHLQDFGEFDAPPCLTSGTLAAGTILANSRFAPAVSAYPAGDAWQCEGRLVAVRLSAPIDVSALHAGDLRLESLASAGSTTDVAGWWLERPWDLIRHLPVMLASDIAALAPTIEPAPASTLTLLGDHLVTLEAGCRVEPMVVLDASAGPILIHRGATISAFTRLVGPCVIGRDSQVLGGRVATSSIGETCRVHGEVSSTIFIGHANKGHDGFVGHSVLGRWTNLGAATVTSNLKNTYGMVHAWAPDGEQNTGLQFLGTLLGDHARTGIGTRLTTGSVVGAGANVVNDGMPPRVIAPFAFGGGTYRLEKFLEVAARVMSRRQVTLGDRERLHLARAHGARWSVG